MRESLSVIAVAIGGALGSVLRYGISRWAVERWGTSFPWSTFAINVTGSFFIGIVLQLATARSGMSPYVRLFFATGVLGGYTTFSTFAFEIVGLGMRQELASAVAYALGSVIAGVLAALGGIAIARTVVP